MGNWEAGIKLCWPKTFCGLKYVLVSHCRCEDVRGDDGTFDKTGECEYEETLIVELGDTELLDERYVIGLLGT